MNNSIYIFLGSYPGKDNYQLLANKYFKSDASFSNDEYERVLFETFLSHGEESYFLSTVNVGKFPKSCKKLCVNIKSLNSVINCKYIPLIGYIQHSKKKALLFGLKKLIKRLSLDSKKITLIACEPHLPYLKVLKYAKTKLKFNTCLIVPDLPENNKRSSNFLYLHMKKKNTASIYKIGNNYVDSYLFFTGAMKQFFKLDNKQYVVKEGIIENLQHYKCVSKEVVCTYIGKTDIQNGVNLIVDAAKKMPDIKFHVYGSGNLDNELKLLSIKNLKYHGLINPNNVDKVLKESTLFVSPRYESDYTNVSFPSKIIKYLSFAKPIITIKLPCYSEKFDKCLTYMEEPTSDALVKSIRHCLSENKVDNYEQINGSLSDLFKDNYANDFIQMLNKVNTK